MDKRKEGFICAAQENVLNTRFYSATILGKGGDGKCRKCGKDPETVGHLVSACTMLCQREYRRRHDRMGLRVYWELCGTYGLERSACWDEEVPVVIDCVGNIKMFVRWFDHV